MAVHLNGYPYNETNLRCKSAQHKKNIIGSRLGINITVRVILVSNRAWFQ